MRNYGVDLIKIIAIFFVICSHVSPYYMHLMPDDFGMYFLSEFGMLGVVLFFSASGFFILNNGKPDQFDYSYKKIINVARVFIIWVLIFYCFDKYVVSTVTDVKQVGFWRYLDVMDNFSEAAPLWFLPAIIGLYVLTPLIRPAFVEANIASIGKTLILMLFVANITIIEKLLNSFFGIPHFVTPSLLLSTQVTGLFSFVLGGYLGLLYKTGKFKPTSSHIALLGVIALISYIILTYLRRYWGHDYYYMKFYIFLLQPACLFFFYLLVNHEFKNRFVKSAIASIGDKVFGIYLTHNFFVIEIHPDVMHGMIAPYFSFLSPYVYTLLYTTVALLIAYGLCSIITRIKYVRGIINL